MEWAANLLADVRTGGSFRSAAAEGWAAGRTR